MIARDPPGIEARIRESILVSGDKHRSDDLSAVTLGEHDRILLAIEAGDAAAAQDAMRSHLANAAGRVGIDLRATNQPRARQPEHHAQD